MIRVSILLAVLAIFATAIFATAVEAQAQQVDSTVKKVAQEPEITDYPKYQIEYPADWKGPRIAGPQSKEASTGKTATTTTAFKKLSNTTKAILVSAGTKSASAASIQTDRVITNQPAQNIQPRIISQSYTRYPSFYSPSGCLTGR